MRNDDAEFSYETKPNKFFLVVFWLVTNIQNDDSGLFVFTLGNSSFTWYFAGGIFG